MSRHILKAINPDKHTVIIGYDRPLDDFFVQIYDREIELHNERLEEQLQGMDPNSPEYQRAIDRLRDDELIVDIGCGLGPKTTLTGAIELASQYAHIPPTLIPQLQNERLGLSDANAVDDHRLDLQTA